MTNTTALNFCTDAKVYLQIADNRIDKGDNVGALSVLFTAKEKFLNNYKILAKIASLYSEMEHYELSNNYWFLFLAKAPVSKHAEAYEALGVNFFFLKDLLLSGYYLRKKTSIDGFLSEENVKEEFAKYLCELPKSGVGYHLAYPFERADFSFESEKAKNCFNYGDYNGAIKSLESIPKQCLKVEDYENLVICYLAVSDVDNAEKTCKEGLKAFGENISFYDYLCGIYDSKENEEKSEYYYKKVQKLSSGSIEDCCKLGTCAMVHNDHKVVYSSLKKIIKEEHNNLTLNYLFGLCCLNYEKYEEGKEIFGKLRKNNPFNLLYNYYYNLSLKLINKDESVFKLLPIPYENELPKQTQKEYKKLIMSVIKNSKSLDKIRDFEILEFGIRSDEIELANSSALILLSLLNNRKARELLDRILLDNSLGAGVKRFIIFTLIKSGFNEKLSMCSGGFFVTVKPRKLIFFDREDGELFLDAYATAVSKTIFWDLFDNDKTSFLINKVYSKYKDEILKDNYTVNEISALIVCCFANEFYTTKSICESFKCRFTKIKSLLQKLKGEKNG